MQQVWEKEGSVVMSEEERLNDLFIHETTIKPDHYRTNQGKYIDLFDKWYHENDLHVFRAIMRATAERYITRYENKNGVIDLEKGIYTLERLKEYEEERR